MKLNLSDYILEWSQGGYSASQIESQARFVTHLETCNTCLKGIDYLCKDGLYLFERSSKRIWYPINFYKNITSHPFLRREQFPLYDVFLNHVETCYMCQWTAGGLCADSKDLRQLALNYNCNISAFNTVTSNPVQQTFNFKGSHGIVIIKN